jgi:hypothetical protein
MSSELSSLYKNRPITLWVEDGLTRAWLRGLWDDADIGLLVAGGNDAVAGAVRDARGAGHGNVFGVRDRDFLATNRAAWLDPTKQPTVFVTEAHELENHLLDFDGLAALSPNHNRQRKTAAQLEAVVGRRARRATNVEAVVGGLWGGPGLNTAAYADLRGDGAAQVSAPAEARARAGGAALA